MPKPRGPQGRNAVGGLLYMSETVGGDVYSLNTSGALTAADPSQSFLAGKSLLLPPPPPAPRPPVLRHRPLLLINQPIIIRQGGD